MCICISLEEVQIVWHPQMTHKEKSIQLTHMNTGSEICLLGSA